MDARENILMFSRHFVDGQLSLRLSLWYSRGKPEDKQYSKCLLDISRGGSFFSSKPENVRDINYPSKNLNKYANKVRVKFEPYFTDKKGSHKSSLKKHHENINNPAFISNKLKRLIESKTPVILEDIAHPTRPIAIGCFTQIHNSNNFYSLIFEPTYHKLSKFFLEDLNRVQLISQQNADTYQCTSVAFSRTQGKIAIKLPVSIVHLGQRNTLPGSLDCSAKTQAIH